MLFSDLSPFVRFAEILHYHTQGDPVYVRDCRIFYVLSGRVDLTVDEHRYSLAPHALFYCPGASVYTISSPGAELISLNFDLTQQRRRRELPYPPVPLARSTPRPDSDACPVEDQPDLDRHILLENGSGCRELLDQILDEFSTRRILYRQNAGCLVKALLVQLLRSSREAASQSAKAVETILGHIHSHYSQPMSNALFSQLTGYHEYYINRLFTRHTGSTIHQYILDVRVRHARTLLLNTDLPLSAIAEQVGFNSNSYFSTYFRQVTGLSPAQFRKKHKNAL